MTVEFMLRYIVPYKTNTLKHTDPNSTLPGQIIRVFKTGRFSLLDATGGLEKDPVCECILRLVRLSGERGAALPEKKGQTFR